MSAGGAERDALAHSWEANAGAWTTAVRERAIPSRRVATDAAIVAACARATGARSGARVLDVGCGEGWLARALAGRGAAVTGIDASAPLVESARASGPGEFVVQSYAALADDPSAVPGPFDLVVCNFALLDDRVHLTLAALGRRLAPGGALLVQTVHPWAAAAGAPYEDGWRTETFAAFESPFPAAMPWYFRTLASWVDAARRAGLVVSGVEEPLHPESRQPLSLLLELR